MPEQARNLAEKIAIITGGSRLQKASWDPFWNPKMWRLRFCFCAGREQGTSGDRSCGWAAGSISAARSMTVSNRECSTKPQREEGLADERSNI